MTGHVMAGVALLAALAGASLGEVISGEVRGRLDRLPQLLLRLAARRLPRTLHDDVLDEWSAELHEILRGAEALPVTRLICGVRFAAGLFRAGPKIGRELGEVGEPPHSVQMDAGMAAISAAPIGLETCPRCTGGRIGAARLTCTLCFGQAFVQPWVAAEERSQRASWARYLAGKQTLGAHTGAESCPLCNQGFETGTSEGQATQ